MAYSLLMVGVIAARSLSPLRHSLTYLLVIPNFFATIFKAAWLYEFCFDSVFLIITLSVSVCDTNIREISQLKQINMREKSLIKENILQYLDFKGVSNYEFYRTTGVSNGVLSQKSGMSEENTMRFLSHYEDVNIEWLLTGKGSMLKTDAPASAVKAIPLIPLDAMAGFGSGSMQIMEWDTESYVIPEFEELDVDFLIRVKGSSMQPKYNSGDLVACKKLDVNNIFWQWNKVYVLDTDQGPLIKRVKKAKTKDCLLIVSENKNYDEFELHLSHVYAIALVVGVIRFE